MWVRTIKRVNSSGLRGGTIDPKKPAVQSPCLISNNPTFVANQKYLNHTRPAAPHRDVYVILYIEVIATDVKHFLRYSSIIHQILTGFFYVLKGGPSATPFCLHTSDNARAAGFYTAIS